MRGEEHKNNSAWVDVGDQWVKASKGEPPLSADFEGEDQLFTGVLADGTPFLFTSDFRDRVGTVTLIRSSNPPVGPSNIQVPRDPAPHGIHGARQLDVLDNGELPDNFGLGRDSVLNVLGGVVGDHLEAYGSVVNVTGGRVGGIAAFRG